MKRFVVLSLLVALLMPSSVAFANTNTTKEVVAPKWEDYVPNKYQEPRMFSRGKSIGELGAGIGLSSTLFLSPVGVPMIVHSTTKLKNIGYYNKKIKFDDGLVAAEGIKNPVERQKYYDNLIKECNFNPKFKAKHDREAIKQAKKADKNIIVNNNSPVKKFDNETKLICTGVRYSGSIDEYKTVTDYYVFKNNKLYSNNLNRLYKDSDKLKKVSKLTIANDKITFKDRLYTGKASNYKFVSIDLKTGEYFFYAKKQYNWAWYCKRAMVKGKCIVESNCNL